MKTYTITDQSVTYLIAALILLTGFLPLSAHAATAKPSCSFTATTVNGERKVGNKDTLLVNGDDLLTLAWESKNATKGVDAKKKTVGLTGSVAPTKSATYKYTFSNGSKKAVCEVSVEFVSAAFDAASLSSEGSKPTITGRVKGIKTVRVTVQAAGGKEVSFGKTAKVKSSRFSIKAAKALSDGIYVVRLYGDKSDKSNPVAQATLSVGVTGSLSVSSIPLLSGGSTGPGTTVPVSYLNLVNTGKTPVTVTGFEVKQNGSAPVAAIIGLSTVDDKGGSRGLVGGAEGGTPFLNGVAIAPTNTVIAPGTRKLFTIKAILGASAGQYAGSQLMLDVTGIVAPGTAFKGTFPVRGTTWGINAF